MSNSFDLAKITHLAHLNMSKEEVAKLLPKVQQVIDFVGKIQKLELTSTKEQEVFLPRQTFRKDEVQKQAIDIAKLSAFTAENYFVVPKVIKDFEQ